MASRRENGGGDVTQPVDCDPMLGQRRGGGAPLVGLWLEVAAMRARHRRGEETRRG
jgi:hypothetical protein